MIGKNFVLKKLIYKQRRAVSSELCDYIVDEIKKEPWDIHSWYESNKNSFYSEENSEPKILFSTQQLQNLLTPHINECVVEYDKIFSFSKCERAKHVVKKLSKVRFNKYECGDMMRQHIDHIHSLFDGNEKGIPALSIIVSLNDGYSGGELYFWENHTVKMNKGDILIFPSSFLFPHGVKKIISGVRYSSVCWGW